MTRNTRRGPGSAVHRGCLMLTVLCAATAHAQFRQEPGKSIGTITTQGNLIVMTLNEGALGTANLFDLAHRTVRFTPDGSRYRVETMASQWDPEFGAPMTGSQAALQDFAFPFSGKRWNSLSVGVTGSMTFGDAAADGAGGGRGGRAAAGFPSTGSRSWPRPDRR